MITRTKSITVLASVLMAIISLMVAVSLPAGYYIIAIESMDGSVRSEIAFSAREVEGLVISNPRHWHFEELRLREILGHHLDSNIDRRSILDTNGKVVTQTGEDPAAPVRKYRHPVYDGGDIAAYVEIERSTTPIVDNTIIIGSLSFLFGLFIFIYFRYSPLRAVRTAYNLMAENEQRLTLALESGDFGIWDLDIKKGSMIWNDRMYEIYGLPRTSSRIEIETWKSCIHPEDRQRVWDAFNPDKMGESGHSEFRIIKPDGTVRHIRSDGLVVRDAGKGTPATLICLNQDITERKQAEEDLRKSEEYFRALTESASDILFIVDHLGVIKYVTPSAQWAMGYSPAEMIGKNAYEFIIPDDHPRAIEEFGRALLTRDVSIFNSFRVRNKKGAVLVLEGFGRNLIHNPVIAGFVMNVRDVTARKQAEEALRQSEEKYRTIIENMDEGYMELDLRGQPAFLNRAAQRILGFSAEELLSTPYKKYVDEKNAAMLFTAFNRVFRTKTPETFEGEAIRKDGARIVVEGSAHVVSNEDGNPAGFRGLFRDITNRKRAEEALRESERRLANIIEFLPDATFAIDLKGCVIAWNRAMEEMTGIKAPGMLGKGTFEYALPVYSERRPTLADLILKPDPFLERKYDSLERKGDVLKAETYMPAIGRYMSMTAVRLRDSEGNTIGAIQSIRDVTERKLLESRLIQAQKMEA
ncbi:MAG: PAS domain S-box protein, partial [Syntrophaceae bacterium]